MNLSFTNVATTSMTINTDCQNEFAIIAKETYSLPTTFDASQITTFDANFTNAPEIDGCKILFKGNTASIDITGLTRYKLYRFRIVDLTNGEIIGKSRWTLR